MQELKEKYCQLLEAYSEQSLNELTAHIIDLYQTGCHDEIKQMRNILSEFIPFTDERINKCYSRLIMTYHPDTSAKYRSEIEEAYQTRNLKKLEDLSHILSVRNYKNLVTSDEYIGDIDYAPEYIMDEDALNDGYHTTDGFEDVAEQWFNHDFEYEDTDGISFYDAVKRKVYGTIKIEMPLFYFSDLEEIEMADYDIDTLGGIEYCVNVENLDLSSNRIYDISMLQTLSSLRELYLSDNQIGNIDALITLKRLKMLDLSNNNIDDISALFYLPELEYVNLSGNRIPQYQIDALREKHIMTID